MVYHVIPFNNSECHQAVIKNGITYSPYINRTIIPVNSHHKLYTRPYFYNSPHIFLDFHNDADFKLLEAFEDRYKRISNYPHQIGRYYIPNKPAGSFISNMIYPIRQSNIINPIQKHFTIEFIYTYQHIDTTEDISSLPRYSSFEKTLYIHFKEKINSKQSNEILEIVFIAGHISITDKYIITKWLPRYKLNLLHKEYVEFDIREFDEPDPLIKKQHGEIYYCLME
jgi:hypothetical protein